MSGTSVRLAIRGVGISRGKAAARLHFYASRKPSPTLSPASTSPEEERARLFSALQRVDADLALLYEKAYQEAGESSAEIFSIHRMLLSDEDFTEGLEEELAAGRTAEAALEATVQRFSVMLEALEDEYLSGRAQDLGDLATQILRQLSGGTTAEKIPDDPYILVATDLTPSETVRLDKSKIAGFVTFQGSANSHTAILARAMGIPALVGIGALDVAYEGAWALLDAAKGELILGADDAERERFAGAQVAEDRIAREHEDYLRSLINKPAVTTGGRKIMIYANLGDASEVDAALSQGAEGIGLLRSEFLYLAGDDYPSEETLFSAYADVAVRMEGRRTIIRTLDIGADKQIPYFQLPKEENPALGLRAIRLSLARKPIFRTQLRAILRASALGRVALMLPMVVSVEEVRQSLALLEECKHALDAAKIPYDRQIETGIMIETPAAALMSEELAREVDFFSVGTNDLLQYTLAADRQNPALEQLCDANREPVLRLIGMSSRAIHRTGGWIGVCGEMAADLQFTQRLVDLGVDELSVSPPYLLGVRGRISECH